MTSLYVDSSASKTKTERYAGLIEEVRVPRWLTSSPSFPGSFLSEMLTVPSGSSYAFFVRPADPLGISTAGINRAVEDLVKSWLAENLTDPAALDPADYLFDSTASEPVPTAWLEAVFAMPVQERHSLVMDDYE